jgi:hypothetical protein
MSNKIKAPNSFFCLVTSKCLFSTLVGTTKPLVVHKHPDQRSELNVTLWSSFSILLIPLSAMKMVATNQIRQTANQGCQMVYFQTKNLNLGKSWRALAWKMLIYFMDIWNILLTFGIFYDH